MKSIVRLAGCAVLVAGSFWVVSRAADEPLRQRGKLLLLDNERVMEGDVERQGDEYRVRRPVGETLIPAANVLCVCDSLADAYAFLRSRSNPQDADERVKLARWCLLHGLRAEALEDAQAAVALKPQSAECKRFLEVVRRTVAHAPTTLAIAAAPHHTPEPALPPIDVSAESMGQFTARVQPILMNACASCHVGERGGTFQLVRAGGTPINRRATQTNLAAALAQINRTRPEASPLLTKSVSIHGEAVMPPLKSRQSPPYKALEDWVKQTIADNPPTERPTATIIQAGAREVVPAAPAPAVAPPAPATGSGSFSADRPASPAPKPEARPAPPPTAPLKLPDPFDPTPFNRKAHPEKAGPGK